ncbi:MAG TPA: peroxiredoxin [Novosphingobium sp.]|nr:peroxiredoxin [Novosphingobium sp.]
MSRAFGILCAVSALMAPACAHAALPAGTKAPAFSTQVAKGGKESGFSLRAALRRGPVVLYFYPKAFTKGCTLEAHAFAEATDDFAKAGATVIGLSADDIGTLKRFSTEECRDKFAVGVASPAIIKAYDVALVHENLPSGLTDRTSYVVGKNGRIVFVHSELDYRDHVRLTLKAVQDLSAKR